MLTTRSQSYPRLYADLRTSTGTLLKWATLSHRSLSNGSPTNFPQCHESCRGSARVLNINWQEHAYLTTMRTSAAIGGRSTEQAAAAALLGKTPTSRRSVTDLSVHPSQCDSTRCGRRATRPPCVRVSVHVIRRNSVRSAVNDALVTQLAGWIRTRPASRPPARAQRSKRNLKQSRRSSTTSARSPAQLAADDRSAATSTECVADLFAAAVVAKLQSRFGPNPTRGDDLQAGRSLFVIDDQWGAMRTARAPA